jgi:hypothetical protein
MPVQLDGSTAYLRHDYGSPIGYPFTLFGWYRLDAGSGFGITSTQTNAAAALFGVWFDAANNLYNYRNTSSGGSSDNLTTEVAEYTGADLAPVMIVATSDSVLTIFTPNNPTGRTFDPTGDVPAEVDALASLVIGCFFRNSSTALFFDGHIAEQAMWTSSLGASEWTSLSGGAAPETVASGSLYDAWDFETYDAGGTYTGLVNSHVLTASGTLSASGLTHPVTRAGDTTAPILSSPTGTATGSTTATGSVTTDEAGPGWAVLTTSATTPTEAQIQAGQDHTGAAAAASDTATLSVGANPAAFSFSGLSASTGYYPHYTQEDPTGNVADAVSGALFTTSAANAAPVWSGTPSAMSSKKGQALTPQDITSLVSDADLDTLAYSITGAPTGVTIDSSTGIISGTPTAAPGVYACTVEADDGVNSPVSSASFNITVVQCVLALSGAGYEFGDGNSPATMAILASTTLNAAVYPLSEWPPATPVATASGATDADGNLADLGDDDLTFGTTYRVIARNPSDGETWAWTMAAS